MLLIALLVIVSVIALPVEEWMEVDELTKRVDKLEKR